MVAAGLDGHCDECNLPIMIGQEIRKHHKTGHWVHDACADNPLAFKQKVKWRSSRR